MRARQDLEGLRSFEKLVVKIYHRNRHRSIGARVGCPGVAPAAGAGDSDVREAYWSIVRTVPHGVSRHDELRHDGHDVGLLAAAISRGSESWIPVDRSRRTVFVQSR